MKKFCDWDLVIWTPPPLSPHNTGIVYGKRRSSRGITGWESGRKRPRKTRMRIKNLQIQNFRILEEVSLEIPDGPQLLIGKNAQGKTSLLESLYFLATSTSHRTRLTRELIRKQAETAFVRVEYLSKGLSHTLSVGLDGKIRRFRLDGEIIARSADLYGHLRAVFFSPEDIEFITGGPHVRRRALDLGLCQKNPRMIGHLLDYRRALKQRNALLKQPSSARELSHLLDAWEPTLIEEGAKVLRERALYTLQLLEASASYYAHLTQSEEALTGEYRSSAAKAHWRKTDEVPSTETLKQLFAQNLRSQLDRDLTMKTTTCGPHRDDVVLSISGASAHRYASQGQKRSIALSTKLAERDLLVEGKDSPVLLVDDVTHEMDEGRCERFLERILSDSQVFLTFTEPSAHRGLLKSSPTWRVEGGRVSPGA